jgi:hypothetical protein
MPHVHYFTARGPLCDGRGGTEALSVVARSVTCPECVAALERGEEEDARWSARGRRPLARIRLVRADE